MTPADCAAALSADKLLMLGCAVLLLWAWMAHKAKWEKPQGEE